MSITRPIGTAATTVPPALDSALAALCAGLNQTRWSRLESGDQPRLGDLLAIQHLFGVESLETFFGECPSRRIIDPDSARPTA
jgi:hypothetical protein